MPRRLTPLDEGLASFPGRSFGPGMIEFAPAASFIAGSLRKEYRG
jgi:hypothetical protein